MVFQAAAESSTVMPAPPPPVLWGVTILFSSALGPAAAAAAASGSQTETRIRRVDVPAVRRPAAGCKASSECDAAVWWEDPPAKMGNKQTTFTEEQLEAYQVRGGRMEADSWMSFRQAWKVERCLPSWLSRTQTTSDLPPAADWLCILLHWMMMMMVVVVVVKMLTDGESRSSLRTGRSDSLSSSLCLFPGLHLLHPEGNPAVSVAHGESLLVFFSFWIYTFITHWGRGTTAARLFFLLCIVGAMCLHNGFDDWLYCTGIY